MQHFEILEECKALAFFSIIVQAGRLVLSTTIEGTDYIAAIGSKNFDCHNYYCMAPVTAAGTISIAFTVDHLEYEVAASSANMTNRIVTLVVDSQ